MAVILLTTLLLSRLGLGNWRLLPVLWALVPFINMFLFMKVPMVKVLPDSESTGLLKMAAQPAFFLSLVLMLCAGASEQAVAQWASLFAEKALALPKVLGDVFGPALFALFMGTGRMIYGLFGAKIKMVPYMAFSAALCVICYAGITLAPYPPVQLAACAVTGFSVSIMWPAVFSLSSARFPLGGTALFAVLALMGDMGCSLGPWIVGLASDAKSSGAIIFAGALPPLETGILVCILFPIVFLVSVLLFRNARGKKIKA
jgi:fucose permease